MNAPTVPTVWIEPSDHDLRARQALVLLSEGKDVGVSDIEVLRRIAELASEPSAVTLGVRVRFVRRDHKNQDVEYSADAVLRATDALERMIEMRPSPDDPPTPPSRFNFTGKCQECGETVASEEAYARHDIEKHRGLARIREIHQHLYCPRLVRCGCRIALYEHLSKLMTRERLGIDWNPLDPFGTEKKP